MASLYYQSQSAVSDLYCQANFSNYKYLFIPKREDKFE